MLEMTKMKFPEGYVCQYNQKVMDLANHLGRRKKKNSYLWDDPEYVILEAGVDDEMAKVGLHLELYKHKTAAQVAKEMQLSEEYVLEQLKKLAYFGVAFWNTDKETGEDIFWVETWIPGTMEMIVNSKENCEKYPIIGYAMEAYGRVRGPKSAGLFPVGVGLMRVIPIETAIDGNSRRASYEEVSKYLNENDIFTVTDCSCRTDRELMGEGCGHLKEDMCIQMGHAAEYYIKTGRGRQITREEAFAIIKKAEENGLMHQIPNVDGNGKTHAICNCCGCGCLSLRTAEMFKNNDMVRSNYRAVVNKEKCVACGQCVEHCPVNALQLGQKLCSTEEIVEDITTDITPRDYDWDSSHWNPDYRTNKKLVVDSGTAPCKTKCPAHIGVQGYIQLAASGRYLEALELIRKENPLPAVCGRICNKRCEEACTRGNVDSPVAIDEIKRFIAEKELEKKNRILPKKRHDYSHKKVAIIGSGPAGLSCAYYLALDGYTITVFEKEKELGGMLRLGIPNFRLEKDILDAEIEFIREMGVEFKTGMEVGKDVTIAQLREQGYDAFYLAIGAGGGRKLGIDGEEAREVISGIDFLREINRGNGTTFTGNIVVIGGGNVAIDVSRAAIRSGASSVTQVCLEKREEMPASVEEIEEALEENVEIIHSYGVHRLILNDGKLCKVELKRCIDVFDEQGRFHPSYDEKDIISLDADYLLVSVGQSIEWGGLLENLELELHANGTVKADGFTYQTKEKDIFVGGDVYTGPRFAIDAIAAGKEAAISIHRYVHPGQSLIYGREKKDYHEFNKQSLLLDGFDRAKRQKPQQRKDISVQSFKDARGVFTEEEMLKEASRCLGCGATIVDNYMCVGCGQCTTKCKFDAIHLERVYDGEGVAFMDMKPVVIKQMLKRKGKIIGRHIKEALRIKKR